jgi:hypothetical protein
MTVMTEFFNYQNTPIDSAGNAVHPLFGKGETAAIRELREYTMKRWGGQNLGSFGVRPVRGGTAWSTHSFGAAWDWRYQDPGPGRAACVNEIIPFFLSHSKELGIQAIHDYRGGRIWRADRPGTEFDGVWVPQAMSRDGMGQTWAHWLHFEVHPNYASDGREVDDKIGVTQFPPFVPEYGLFSLWPWATNKPTLRVGSVGDPVRYLQGVMRVKLGYAIGVDGNFGNITQNFVKWFQASNALLADGIVGPKTWAKIDEIAKR